MFSKFQYDQIPLSSISLDLQNPRLVSQTPFKTEDQVVEYLFEHEELAELISRIVAEGKNRGAEQPYVIKGSKKNQYIVIEGNRRISAYKLLTGALKAPKQYAGKVPKLSEEIQETLKLVDCSIAPSRASLDKVMARAHFGRGEKERWKYLGSRQVIFKRWKKGEKLAHLANTFEITQTDVRDFILEYLLYEEALKLGWTQSEKQALLNPKLQFNPPVRFLQTGGHKESMGIDLDRTNLKVKFKNSEARKKYKHLINSLIVNPKKGLKATSLYPDVFDDYAESGSSKGGKNSGKEGQSKGDGSGTNGTGTKGSGNKYSPKKYSLFSYDVTAKSGLLLQLMDECSRLSAQSYPAAATSLLRSMVEALLKHIIDDQNANPKGTQLSLATAIDVCLSAKVSLPKDDKKVLKQFKKDHLDYVNLGMHGNVVPSRDRTLEARNCIDQFVKKNV